MTDLNPELSKLFDVSLPTCVLDDFNLSKLHWTSKNSILSNPHFPLSSWFFNNGFEHLVSNPTRLKNIKTSSLSFFDG
ncbi:hypothetical protein L596_027431 [Steinernema carpocapsae]|uniref:Uncharacterized protein n=1 Tax=Steinernema carpocapsae TaxID=34508 RepID=A0A4U5M4K3_STECR|nr:hypothetical protein L596_027431 [Steinernema carpocapsae]